MGLILTMDRINQLLPKEKLIDFCGTWQIEELSVFGSILRDDFGPDSDIDLLVTFAPTAEWNLFDHVQMQHELEALLGRSVDLLTRQAVEHSQNWLRRAEILNSAQLYISANEVPHATG
jgi:predicted nucleotidyltransferase